MPLEEVHFGILTHYQDDCLANFWSGNNTNAIHSRYLKLCITEYSDFRSF